MNHLDTLVRLAVSEGSIWKAPNKVWKSSFANNKKDEELHPAIVGKVKKDKQNVVLIPGTRHPYKFCLCIFKVRLSEKSEYSYFLFDLRMTFKIELIKEMERGWDSKLELNEKELKSFKELARMCFE